MITGDTRAKAEAMGAALGLDGVFCEKQPEDKARIDGPALAVADVGIAMPQAADIARATADIMLMDDRLEAVADIQILAQETLCPDPQQFPGVRWHQHRHHGRRRTGSFASARDRHAPQRHNHRHSVAGLGPGAGGGMNAVSTPSSIICPGEGRNRGASRQKPSPESRP
ncbi:MAG: heavy metal translocating P-type ATPase [Rhodospirillaceae bacterium]|nr:MAG: heavy metal translocating P-type ATPase [Rhodospirillaceae bacterium]